MSYPWWQFCVEFMDGRKAEEACATGLTITDAMATLLEGVMHGMAHWREGGDWSEFYDTEVKSVTYAKCLTYGIEE